MKGERKGDGNEGNNSNNYVMVSAKVRMGTCAGKSFFEAFHHPHLLTRGNDEAEEGGLTGSPNNLASPA
jgi:hypothetical protein